MKTLILSILVFFLISNISYAKYGLLFFNASWCMPCHALKNSISENIHKDVIDAGNNQVIYFYDIDIDKNPDMRNAWKVGAVPTSVLVEFNKDGSKATEIDRKVGGMSKEAFMGWLKDKTQSLSGSVK